MFQYNYLPIFGSTQMIKKYQIYWPHGEMQNWEYESLELDNWIIKFSRV